MSEEHNVSNYYLIQSHDRYPSQNVWNFSVPAPNFTNSYSLEVATVQIPYTWFAFNTNQNSLAFQVNGGATVVATITPGNYDQYSLPIALVAAMNAVAGGPTYTITISPITALITITQNAGTFLIIGRPGINDLLGFSTSVNTAAAVSQTGINLINLAGTVYVDVYSQELTRHSTRFADSAHAGSTRFLRIPVSDYAFGSCVIYKPTFRHYNMKPEAANDIDIQIKDMYGNFINLNGRDFYIKLKFHSDKPHRTTVRAGNHNDYFANNNIDRWGEAGTLANKL